ncbi:toll-like receptor 13 isoform X1 [Clinocottus analis]|uniref:toll-like receptor 13 isoform X1 n=1 Tax=Clinocottus analis TaxID=304258 RepID=UPI0035C00A3B
MAPGVKKDKTMTERGSEYFKLSLFFLLLNIISFVVPVTGYYLKLCRISDDIAICTKRKLNAVPQDIPSTVKGFDLSDNNISEIQAFNFKNFSVLTQLDLKHNKISKIGPGAFANLISLKKLNLNRNKLGKLGDDLFQGLINLTELNINRNGIKSVASTSFKSLTSLTFLDFSNNKLHRLTNVHTILQHLPTLQVLSVESNDITTFDSSELSNRSLNLTYLDLSGNPIAIFRITADVFPNLTWLNIGYPSSKRPMEWDIQNKTFLSRVSTLDISQHIIGNDAMKTLLEDFNPSLKILRMNGMKHTNLTALIRVSCSITTVSTLELQHNNLLYVHAQFFQLCINVTEINLAMNKIQNIREEAFRSLRRLKILSLAQNKLPSVPAATSNLPTLRKLDFSTNSIKTFECNDFTNLTNLRELSLNHNKISALKRCVFKDLIRLEVLKLQNNIISELDGAFQKYLPNLKQLHLNLNKLTTINNGEFAGLQSLQNLSLEDNEINIFKNGSFLGLWNLTALHLNKNKINEEGLHKGLFHHLINLKTLDLRENNIQYRSSRALTDPPFSKLSHLETLVYQGNSGHGKSLLPSNFLQGLTNLLSFNTRTAQLVSLHKDTFTYTPQLQKLDMSSNDLRNLYSELFYPIRGLEALYISTLSLPSLDFLIKANLTKLEFLQARENQFSVYSEEVIKSLPALLYLDLQNNTFTCNCDNSWFHRWVVTNKQTQVYDADNFVCNYPPDTKGTKLLDLDDRYCTVDTEFIYFISSTSIILLFMLVSFTYHFLKWQLVYAYYLFQALLFDLKSKNKLAPNQYDAFVSYNTHDEPWVIRELLPKLEEEQGWRLCLHHRDFEPGKPIMNNITDAIYGSRKTICVISRRYLESEWCSREIQVASFRLFDEQKDVLILVFLEDIPIAQLSPYYRMRKMLKRRTYLSWTRAGEHPELFWEKLRQALKTGEEPDEDRFLLSVEDRP